MKKFKHSLGCLITACMIVGTVHAATKEIPGILAQGLTYGLDGRIYGLKGTTNSTATSILALDLLDDSATYDPVIEPFKAATFDSIEAYFSLPNTLVTRNGQLILASRPWAENNENQNITNGCPAQKVEYIDGEQIYNLIEGSYGAIIKYNPWAETAEERFIDLTSRFGAEICPNGVMAIDAEDNIYFISEYENTPRRIYRVAPDGQNGPVLLHTFVANSTGDNAETASTEGFGPSVLKVSSTPGTLYGINYKGGTNGNGTVFRIQLDEQQQPVYRVLRHARATEDGVMGVDATNIGGFSQQGLLEYNNRLYYTTQAGTGHFGTLSSISLTAEDTHTSWQAHKTFVDDMMMGMILLPTQEGRPIGDLILGRDNQFYGLLSTAAGSKVLYRFNPADASFTVLENRSRVPSLITGGLNGKLYWLEEIMQGADAGQTFLVEYDPALDGPFITAFYTPTPEQDWSSNLTTNLIWQTENATSCTASGDWTGSKAIANATGENITLDSDKEIHEFTLTCTDGTNEVSRTLPVSIKGEAPTPVITDFRSTDYNITAGNSVYFTLSWQTENAASCTIWRGGVAEHNISSNVVSVGSLDIAANSAGTREYQLICTGLGGDTVEWTPALFIHITAPTTSSGSGGGSSFNLLMLLPLGLLALMQLRRRNGMTRVSH